MTNAEFPEKLEFLFQPHRYKVAHGGRGSGKSWSFARALLIQGASKPLRILCAREVQLSIKQSVHTLLEDQIAALGLTSFYEVLNTEIRGRNGTEIGFTGLAAHTVDSIKSYEGVDICWVEEAHTVSKRSWDILVPTIRKPKSEIWVSFNPEMETDEAYKRFVSSKPSDAVVAQVNYTDNPWFPATLESERLDCQRNSPDDYANIWEGKCRSTVVGSIYEAQLNAARNDGRICPVPYDPTVRVDTAWDLGVGDATAIWFYQTVGKEIRLIDYYEASGEGLPHYAAMLDKKSYLYGRHVAPHDIRVRELGSGKSRLEVAQSLGIKFEVAPQLGLEDGIHAVRMMFPRLWFDAKKCVPGLEALGKYRRQYNKRLEEFSATPVHDWTSHCADALRYLATSHKTAQPRQTRDIFTRAGSGGDSGGQGWLGV